MYRTGSHLHPLELLVGVIGLVEVGVVLLPRLVDAHVPRHGGDGGDLEDSERSGEFLRYKIQDFKLLTSVL